MRIERRQRPALPALVALAAAAGLSMTGCGSSDRGGLHGTDSTRRDAGSDAGSSAGGVPGASTGGRPASDGGRSESTGGAESATGGREGGLPDGSAAGATGSGGEGSGGRGGGGRGSGGEGPDAGSADPDCALATVLCVDDEPSPEREFATIQAAVDAATPGDTVLVFGGTYGGFRVSAGGTEGAPLTVRAATGAAVDVNGAEGDTENVIRIQNTSYVHIEGFRVARPGTVMPYDYDYACIAARAASAEAPMLGIVVRNNEVSGCSPAGMYLSQCRGLLLEGNSVHDNVHDSNGENGMGVYVANAGSDSVTIRGNRFVDNDGPGVHFNGDASVGGDGLQIGHFIEGNFVVGNGQNGFNMDGVQEFVLVNNVFAANANHGVRGFRIDGAEGPRRVVAVANTFVGNGASGLTLTDDGGENVLFDNLLVTNADGDLVVEESVPAVAANFVFGSPDGLLVDAGARDFHLASGASVIDSGVGAFEGHDAPSTDHDGRRRSGLPDVGAFEAAR